MTRSIRTTVARAATESARAQGEALAAEERAALTLTDDEKQMATRMGVSHEALTATKVRRYNEGE